MTLRQAMIWMGLAAGLGGGLALAKGPFAPPAEGVVVVRRDWVPLDVDAMQALSQQLAVLAKGQGGERPEDRRAVAQMVALGLVLQPGNAEFRKFAELFANGVQRAQGDAKPLAEARAGVWETLAWLASPAAEGDGHALAACLGDVLAVADPKHPQAAALLEKGEQGAWQGWVGPLAAFTRAEDPQPEQPADVKPAPIEAIRLAKAKVTAVLWTIADRDAGGSALRAVPLTMDAAARELDENANPGDPLPVFSCRLKTELSWSAAESFRALSNVVKAVVEAEHGPMPAGVRLTFTPGGELNYGFEVDRDALSGALAVLMNAAVSGTVPRATVIGEIRKDGSFRLPLRAWERLRALATSGDGGRLVLPTEAGTLLPSILALEDPEFFLKYEVLLASNLKELVERSALTPAGAMADACTRFAEIRDKRGAQPVPTYVANRVLRQRLEEIVRDAPYHGSARMLALQGAAKRPTALPRPLLAAEVLLAIRPMAWIATTEADHLESDALTQTMDLCKKNATRLERYAEMRDRDLLDKANDLGSGIRSLTRALKNRTDENGIFISHERDLAIFKRAYEATTALLKDIAETP